MTKELIKRNYERHLWTKKMVAYAVLKGIITGTEFQEITGSVLDMTRLLPE
jgi:hypothetical protein